ncbi:MAG: hypothetical protein QOH68_3958, partial [Nocardioidaceae bacterium]|nr:hypothetical protein [Nocardioidaceae bacterium]
MLSRRAPAALALAAALLAGLHTPSRAADSAASLRVNHVQARGTHNSTHRDHNGTLPGVAEWDYDHRPLVEQLEDQDVRQVELDVHYNWAKDVFEVYHVWFGDDRATCDLLETCLRQVRSWSDAHPRHLPILVMIEPKDAQLEDEDPFTSPLGLPEMAK